MSDLAKAAIIVVAIISAGLLAEHDGKRQGERAYADRFAQRTGHWCEAGPIGGGAPRWPARVIERNASWTGGVEVLEEISVECFAEDEPQ